jgi:hypothetical protein
MIRLFVRGEYRWSFVSWHDMLSEHRAIAELIRRCDAVLVSSEGSVTTVELL